MSEINQIMACDDSSESILRDAESTAVLSSPYFIHDDDKVTNLFVKEFDYRDLVSESCDSKIQVKLNGQDEVEKISFAGFEVARLDIKDVFVEGEVLFIEKNDGTVIRLLNADLTDRNIQRIVDEMQEVIESSGLVTILTTKWEAMT